MSDENKISSTGVAILPTPARLAFAGIWSTSGRQGSRCAVSPSQKVTGQRLLSLLSLSLLAFVSTKSNEVQAAPPAWQASSAIASSTGANVTVTLPAHQTNDILLLQVVVRDVDDTITWPAGWTQIATVDRGATGRYWWAWKRAASGAETNPLVNKSTATGDTYAAVTTYRGASTIGDPWEVKGTPNTSTVAGHVLNGITTLSADSLIVASLCGENNSAASVTFTATNPATLAQVLYVESGTGSNGACAAGAAARTAIGATGNVTATWSNTVVGSGGIVFALKPLPAVSSINRASTDPTLPNTSVSWTVVFSKSVSGVNAADFALVQAGGVTGASITSVTGGGTTWTVTANTGTGTVGTLGLNLVDDDSIVDGSGEPLGGTGAGNGNFTGQVYTLAPTVISINTASTNPAIEGAVVSWTVTFSASVTGVDAADFSLVQAGGVAGASITSVTGAGTTWTVTVNSGSGAGTLGLNLVDDDTIIDAGGRRLGGTGAGNGNFTGQAYTINLFCSPPANVPGGVTVSCVCDRFGRASLNPSTIYGANWIVSKSDSTAVVPYINATTGNLRLTENTGNNAKAATVPGIFPAAGNYISVEFQHFAYGGSGADGIAVTLSDYSVPAVPGAFGGSLGYAQKTGAACPTLPGTPCPGFAGGWIGVAVDEFGNYQNPTEGRIGGPGARVDSVGVRGSGSDVNGYNWIAGTATLAPQVDNTGSATPAPGYYYQVIVDARNDPTSTSVAVNRDTGAGYTSLINVADVYTAATAQGFTQSSVPANWQISFTGSTGGSTNIHEISGLRVCAQTVAPPSGGTASGFNAIDEAYATPPATPAVQNFLNGHIYMKLAGTPFKLWVAALNNNQILTTYAAGGAKNVTVKLVDNSDSVCVLDSTQANYCSAACTAKAAVTGGSQTVTFVAADAGKKQSANFTLNSSFKNLAAIMTDGTTTACSTDAFSVRPASIASVTSSNATNTGTGGVPVFKAGGDNFSLTATTTGIAGNPSGYIGVLKIDSTAVSVAAPATVAGTFAPVTFPAATSATPSSTATGSTFKYGEVGVFSFLGYNPATDATSQRGVYDGVYATTECAAPVTVAQCDTFRAATWTGVDSISAKGDCVANNYSNTKDANGKYGCNFGIVANAGPFGRFIPDHFAFFGAQTLTNRSDLACASTFTYLGEPFRLIFQLEAQNASNATTRNYISTLAKLDVTDGTKFGALTGNTATLNTRVSATALGSNVWQTGASAGSTNVLGVDVTVARAAGGTVDGAFDTTEIGIAPVDTDGVLMTALDRDWDGVAGNDHKLFGTTNLRFGRISIQNASGSELLPLSMPARVQYYKDATDGWVTNSPADTCTSIPNIALTNPNGAWSFIPPATVSIRIKSPNDSTVSLSGTSPSFTIGFTAPNGEGYADVSADTGLPNWLKFDWDGNSGTPDTGPSGRATFGIYKGSPRHIYLRERY